MRIFVALILILWIPPSAFADESTTTLNALVKVFATGEGNHPLDPFELLNQSVPGDRAGRRPSFRNLTLHRKLPGGGTEEVQWSRRFQKEPLERKRWVAVQPHEPSQYELRSQGRLLVEFLVPARAATFYEHYLIFVRDLPETETSTLHFVDLRYFESNLGRSPLPVFQMPVSTVSSRRGTIDLQIQRGALVFNDQRVPGEVLKFFSHLQQMAHSITVNLLNPSTYTSSLPVAEAFRDATEHLLDLQDGEFMDRLSSVTGSPDTVHQFGRALNELIPHYRDETARAHDALTAAAIKMAKVSEANRTWTHRLKLLFAQLSVPQPKETHTIVEALALIVGKRAARMTRTPSMREGIFSLLSRRSVQLGLSAATVWGLATLFPSEAAAFSEVGLQAGAAGLEAIRGKAQDVFSVAHQAVDATFEGFNPGAFAERYLSPDNLPRFTVGLSAIFATLYLVVAIPHLMVNVPKLAQDLWKIDGPAVKSSPEGRSRGWLARLRLAFIRRQNRVHHEFLNMMSASELNRIGRSARVFSEADNKQVDAILNTLRAKQSRFSTMMATIRNGSLGKAFLGSTRRSSRDIESFSQGLRHFLFSYCSFTTAGVAYIKAFQGWFGLRSFVWHPNLWATMAIYPNFWKTATQVSNRVTRPTVANGGFRSIDSELYLQLFNRATLKALQALERQITLVEQRVSAMALARTYKQLVYFMNTESGLTSLLAQTRTPTPTSKEVERLTAVQRRFYRTYYASLLNETLRRALAEVAGGTDMTTEDAKRDLIRTGAVDFAPTDSKLEEIMNSVETPTLYDEIRAKAEDWSEFEPFQLGLLDRTLKLLDPGRNRQIKRMQTVRNRLQNPDAVARAVRAMIVSNVVDKPIELAFCFICLVGIREGMLSPLQPEMFGANSWFYLSTYVFLTGYLVNVVLGVFGDPWQKLQQDELNEGGFKSVPRGRFSDLTFWEWYRLHFNRGKNGLARNHLHYTKLIFANMKAALTTYLVTNLLTLGRMDLDAYVVGYMLVYLLPMGGMSFKIEQAFELASNYSAKHFPKDLRAHPDVQGYILSQASRHRLKFNLFYKVYENLLGMWFGSFELMHTPEIGSRALPRILFGGYTVTEAAAQTLDTGAGATQSFPALRSCILGLRHLVTNRYTDWQKYIPDP